METYLVIAFVLFALGLVALGGEFAFPAGGYFVIAALVLFVAAVGVVLLYGNRTEATVAVVGFCVGVPVLGWLLVQAWKSMALKSGLDPKRAGGTVAQAMPELTELDALRGQVGKTATPMRPAGTVLFDGRRIDALTEGVMLDAGVWVQCVGVKAGRVVVRRVTAAATLTEMELDDPK
jgi:membrane-bound serine protease (ClpP class)